MARLVDILESVIRPGHCRCSLVWLLSEYRKWNSQRGIRAELIGKISNNKQIVQLRIYEETIH